MSDPTSGMAASDALRGPAPVAKDDPGLAELRALARKQGRTLRWAAVALLLTSLIVPAAVLLDSQVQTAQMLGYSQSEAAVVRSVRPADDQPRKQGSSGPAWTVEVRWARSDGVGQGAGDLRSPGPPFTVGDTVTVHTLGDDPEVSFRTTGDLRALGGLALAFLVGCGGGAVFSWRRGRRWPARVMVVTRAVPQRIGVRGTEIRGRGGPGILRWAGEQLCIVHYRPVDRATGGGTVAVDSRRDIDPPVDGDVLDVWSLPQNQRGPFAVRRVSDGRWWTGRGPDPVPSIPAR